MAIRMTIGDIAIECDTAAEALELMKVVNSVPTDTPPSPQSPTGGTLRRLFTPPPLGTGTHETFSLDPRRLQQWFAQLSDNEKRAVVLVRDTPNGVTTDAMATAFACERSHLKYSIRSLRGAINRAGLPADEILDSQETRVDGEKGSRYVMSEDAKAALANL